MDIRSFFGKKPCYGKNTPDKIQQERNDHDDCAWCGGDIFGAAETLKPHNHAAFNKDKSESYIVCCNCFLTEYAHCPDAWKYEVEEEEQAHCEVCKEDVNYDDYAGCCRDGECPHHIEHMCTTCGSWNDETEQWSCPKCA